MSARNSLQILYKQVKSLKNNICHAIINQKKVGVAILISDEVDFRAKKITMDR